MKRNSKNNVVCVRDVLFSFWPQSAGVFERQQHERALTPLNGCALRATNEMAKGSVDHGGRDRQHTITITTTTLAAVTTCIGKTHILVTRDQAAKYFSLLNEK